MTIDHVQQTVPTETALRIVASQRRRAVIQSFHDRERNVATFESLVEHVSPENPPPDPGKFHSVERIRHDLHHNHLPRLEEAGLLEYDDRSATIRYRPNDRVESLHQFVTTELE